MQLGSDLECLASFPAPEGVSQFSKDLPYEWITRALEATGVATVRRRRLPAEQVPWLVIGMALFRDRPIAEVVDKLDLVLPNPISPTVAPSAVSQARDRLGESPMAWLFAHSGDVWGHQSADANRWRGLALYALDGTTLRVADSVENREFFGGQTGRDQQSSGYPMVRVSALMAVRSHLLVTASFGPYANGEYTYAEDLWRCVPDDSVLIADRLYWSATILHTLTSEGTNRHWLTRAKSNVTGRRIKRLGPNDELVELKIADSSRAKDPTLPKTWIVRVIRYQKRGFKPERLLTSLLDAKTHPAAEIVALYHERWEIELGYREIKTDMLDSVPLRSKSIDRVRQEIWGLLIAYNLVRLEMARVAEEAGLPPTRISFVTVFRMICDEWLWCAIASPGAIPRHLKNLRSKISRLILPPRRPERAYPRAVKIKMSNYARKRPKPIAAKPSKGSK
jgi:hypothetical protein